MNEALRLNWPLIVDQPLISDYKTRRGFVCLLRKTTQRWYLARAVFVFASALSSSFYHCDLWMIKGKRSQRLFSPRTISKLWVIKTSLVQWDYSLQFVNKRLCQLVIIISIHIAVCVVKYYYYCCCFYFILLHNRGKGLPRVTMCCMYNILYTACLTGIIVITKVVRKPYVQKGSFTAAESERDFAVTFAFVWCVRTLLHYRSSVVYKREWWIHGRRNLAHDITKSLQRYSQSCRPHGSRPFHDLTGTIPLFHCSNCEAVNGGMASGGGSCQRLFWEWPVTKEPAALWIALLLQQHVTYG